MRRGEVEADRKVEANEGEERSRPMRRGEANEGEVKADKERRCQGQ